MFDFLKKLKPAKEKPKSDAKKAADKKPKKEDPKKAARQAEREKRIHSVMEKTGWDYKEASEKMRAAKKTIGISYKDYDRNDFFAVAPEDQEETYQAIVERKARRKAHKEREEAEIITKIMAVTGWDQETAVANVKEAQKRTGCTYKEFLIYRFFDLTPEEQEKVFVAKFSRKLTAKYDVDPKFVAMLYDKEATNNYFPELVRRPWCVNTKISLEDFTEKFAESKRIIYKPLDGHRGMGVEAFDVNRENAQEVFNELQTFPEGVVEQYVVQHSEMSRICPTSVNTIRIVTISSNTQPVTPDGKYADIAYASLRMGGGNSIVDNFHSGGMVANIDLETGKMVTDAADMDGHVFANHPATGTKIKGFQIPFFQEALDMVTEAIKVHKVQGYLGWDVAITEDGPLLIELNVVPGVVLLSTPYVAEKKGMKYVMEKYL